MNATQLAGLAAFGSAALICFRFRWGLIATINAVLALECVFGLRHHIHTAAVEMMGPLYDNRANVQITLIGIALTLFAASTAVLLLRKGQRTPGTVTAATLLAVALFLIEMISLHAIDAVLYGFVGGLRVVGWLWLALGLFIVGAAIRHMKRQEFK